MEVDAQSLVDKLYRLGGDDDTWIAAAARVLEAGGQTARATFLHAPDDRAVAFIAKLEKQQQPEAAAAARAASGAAAGASGGGEATARARGGSADPGPSTSSAVSQRDYLAQQMRSLMYSPGNTSSSDGKDPRHYTIELWDMTAEEKEGIVSYVADKLRGKTIDRPGSPYTNHHYSSEQETNYVFGCDACERVNNVNKANRVDMEWRYEPATTTPDNSKPDFVLILRRGGKLPHIMVGEGKYRSVLDTWQLVQAFTNVRSGQAKRGERVAMCSALEQVLRYMDIRKHMYSFLTTHELTFFIKCIGDRVYAVTDGFHCTTLNPSVPEMVYYFSDLSLADFEARDATGMPASSAAGGGPGPSDGGGDGNSGAGGRPGEPSSGGGGGGGGGSGNSMGQSHKTSANGGSAANVRVTHQVSKRQAEGWEQEMGAGGAHGGMIADDALSLGASLGRGLCGTVSASRWDGHEAVVKCVDACNSKDLIPHLQQEAYVLSGRLRSLQGVCVPLLYACGPWEGGMCYVLVTSLIRGEHPQPSESKTSQAAATAVQGLKAIHALGVAHGDLRRDNILVSVDGKVWFIDFGKSYVDPTPSECENELQELRDIFGVASPASPASPAGFDSPDSA